MNEPLTYEMIEDMLETLNVPMSVNELYGQLTGMMCLMLDPKACLALSMELLDLEEAPETLNKLISNIHSQLADLQCGFQLWTLQSTRMKTRAIDLKDWVDGYFGGLGHGVTSGAAPIDPESFSELLRDLDLMMQLDVRTAVETSVAEEALTEIEEFLRLSAIGLYLEQLTAKLPTTRKQPTIH